MNIGDVASASGLPAKTIRYYEDIGLVRPARSENGYRHFRETDIHKLAFLGRARSLGFTIDETLKHLVTSCHGDSRPECPILDDLAGASDEKVD